MLVKSDVAHSRPVYHEYEPWRSCRLIDIQEHSKSQLDKQLHRLRAQYLLLDVISEIAGCQDELRKIEPR